MYTLYRYNTNSGFLQYRTWYVLFSDAKHEAKRIAAKHKRKNFTARPSNTTHVIVVNADDNHICHTEVIARGFCSNLPRVFQKYQAQCSAFNHNL